MTWFLFAGDMLVMLFIATVAVWVFWRSPDSAVDRAGRIPLDDEAPPVDPATAEEED